MENLTLPVAVNCFTKDLDIKVLRWAFSRKIIQSKELQEIQVQKINYFAGYLFPQISEQRLAWIMKCFLWLFLVDDLQERVSEEEFRSFIASLSFLEKGNGGFSEDPMVAAWRELRTEMSATYQADWLAKWDAYWASFLEGQLWEKANKSAEKVPELMQYRAYRPYLSGVFFAFQLLKGEYNPLPTCESKELEYKIARWICLGNDLISPVKELQSNDCHNEVILMALHSGANLLTVKNYLESEQERLGREINRLSLELSTQAPACHQWLEGLNLLMGGCVFWSDEVTLRYGSHLNGVAKT